VKKRNVILLATFGAIGMVSSLAIFSAWFVQKPIEQSTGVVTRAGKYGTPQPAQDQKQMTRQELKEKGLTDQEVDNYFQTGQMPRRFMGW